MKTKKILSVAVLAFFVTILPAQNTNDSCSKKVIEASIQAFGGAEVLNSLHSLQLKGFGHRLMREQSERSEGPYITDYFDIEIKRDLKNNNQSSNRESKSFGYELTYLVNDSLAARDMNHSGRWFPVPKTMELDMALTPEQILKTALLAKDVHCQPDSLLQNVPHHVLAFQHNGKPVKLFINKNTNLITAVETYGPHKSNNYHVWGDIKTTIFYSMYSLEKNNLRYPYQMDIYLNSEHAESILLVSLEQNMDFTEEIVFPDAAKELLQKYYGRDLSPPLAADKVIEQAKGLNIIPGSWFSSIIKQDDGLVILESPISSEYGEQILQLAEKLYPAENIRAVINTSAAWPHIGGLRPFIAAEIPVYHSGLNTGIIKKLAAADYSTAPDRQQKLEKQVKSFAVSENMSIGQGSNRIILYPLNKESSEGMLMVYFPQHKLLYTTDLVQSIDPNAQPLFREYWLEILEAIDEQGLEVETIYGMHLAPTSLSDLKKALHAKAKVVEQ